MAAGRAARTLAWITGNVSAIGPSAAAGSREPAPSSSKQVRSARTRLGADIKAFSEPDAQVARVAREAIAIGRRFGDPDIEFLALAQLGGLFVMTDRVAEGLASPTRPWQRSSLVS
jgi:hypothetical protein